MVQKILIANRGEIALRIIRACRELGIKTVAIYSKADELSLHTRFADEAICVGPNESTKSYLNMPSILSAAELTNADSIHPGYGFLSENYKFAEIVEKHKIKFIGPKADIIKKMGDKIEAKKIAKQNGLPVIEGSDGGVKDVGQAKSICKKIGYPILIKASGGGGGKGMKIVESENKLEELYSLARLEAKKYFGNDEVYIEKYFKNPRHIEVQILSGKNRTIHLNERDCSVQRKHQKLIEETPSPVLDEKTRSDLLERTTKMVESIGYEGAGTVEYIYENGKFYFLEMNTRVQVEHPVTEVQTGIDIVKEQIWIAHSGETALKQSDISARGHSIECRITAEDPYNNFMPSPGTISSMHLPSGMGVRIDTHIYEGYEISPYYDSMIAKIIVHAPTREESINRMKSVLTECVIEGISTIIPYQLHILNDQRFISGNYDTSFLDKLN